MSLYYYTLVELTLTSTSACTKWHQHDPPSPLTPSFPTPFPPLPPLSTPHYICHNNNLNNINNFNPIISTPRSKTPAKMNHIKKPATTHHKKAHKSPVAHKKRSNVAHQKAPHQQMGAAQRAFTTTTAPQRKMKAAVPAFAQQPKQQKSFMSAPQATTTPAFFNNTPFVSPAVQFLQQKRNMAMLTGQYLKVLVPCDPRFPDDEVISVLNQKTGLIEPVCFFLFYSYHFTYCLVYNFTWGGISVKTMCKRDLCTTSRGAVYAFWGMKQELHSSAHVLNSSSSPLWSSLSHVYPQPAFTHLLHPHTSPIPTTHFILFFRSSLLSQISPSNGSLVPPPICTHTMSSQLLRIVLTQKTQSWKVWAHKQIFSLLF